MIKLIYLAAPYSHPDEKVRLQRFDAINKAAGNLIKSGRFVFSPISHSHPIAMVSDLPTGFDYWGDYDRRMVGHCDELFVLMLDGWEKSIGVQVEIQIAKCFGKPISYIGYTTE